MASESGKPAQRKIVAKKPKINSHRLLIFNTSGKPQIQELFEEIARKNEENRAARGNDHKAVLPHVPVLAVLQQEHHQAQLNLKKSKEKAARKG